MNPEKAFIDKINVDDIINYLKHKGWVRRNSLHKDILVYKRTEEDNKYWEINVPKEEEDDPFFCRVVEDAIYRLSMFESRSKSDILIDICNLNLEKSK